MIFFIFLFFVCVIKFYLSIKEIEKASDIGIRRGQKEYPLASVNNEVISVWHFVPQPVCVWAYVRRSTYFCV